MQLLKQVDILSFGGTKIGMMLGEAVILFDCKIEVYGSLPEKATTQLVSKCALSQHNFLLSSKKIYVVEKMLEMLIQWLSFGFKSRKYSPA